MLEGVTGERGRERTDGTVPVPRTSPISAGLVARAVRRQAWPALDGGRVWWLEHRPDEDGRSVVCSTADGDDVVTHTDAAHDVRSLVHEYGGLPFAVRDGVIWYCNFDDQRVWRRRPTGDTAAVTPPAPGRRSIRYADLSLSPDGTWLTAVRERHEPGGVHNDVVAIAADGSGDPEVLVGGRDFYAAPRVSPDGMQLCWLSWEHPCMPWDRTALSIGNLSATGTRVSDVGVVDRPGAAIFQPAWSPHGILYFISDADGWWNLYRLIDGRPAQVTRQRAELGLPLWRLGTGTYAFLDEGRVACLVNLEAALRLHVLHTDSGELEPTAVTTLLCEPSPAADDGEVAVIAGTERTLPRVRRWRPPASHVRVVSPSHDIAVDDTWLATPEALAVTTTDGHVVHALYWPPTHPPAGDTADLPPLLVDVHGGPTGQVRSGLQLATQFWTSRGFGVVAPNYGGSSGYGRAYRERLRGAWGVVDVADCVSVARWLAGQGLADPDRLAIRGQSAGGYTALAALTQVDDFTAGVSLFGVSDLRLLAAETHKFESRYIDRLVGDDPAAWSDRAPIEHVDRIAAPLLLLQGEEDEIVPPSQAERIAARLDAERSPYAYATFPGEQHGFRHAASIRRALEVELSFYAQVWRMTPAEDVVAVKVHHLT